MDESVGFSNVDWLFSVGKLNPEVSVIAGSSVPYGSLYIGKFSKQAYIISSNFSALTRLRKYAVDERINNLVFIQASSGALPFRQESIEYLAIADALNTAVDCKIIIRQAASILNMQGVVSLPLQGNIAKLTKGIKADFKADNLNFSEFFWSIPSFKRATWSGRMDDRNSYKLFIELVDVYNASDFLPLWVKRRVFSGFGKKALMLLVPAFYFLRKFFLRDCVVFAAKSQEGFISSLPFVTLNSFVRKSKETKEGRVIFFVNKPEGKKAYHFSRFPEFSLLLRNDLNRNAYSKYLVSLQSTQSGTEYLVSDLIKGGRLDIYSPRIYRKCIEWLFLFQDKTFSGYWSRQEWKIFIFSKTKSDPEIMIVSEKFLDCLEESGRLPARVAEHGDFDFLNIIKASKEMVLLDWEFFNAVGDDFFDFSYFLFNIYTEIALIKKILFKDFLRQEPYASYVRLFLDKKKLKSNNCIVYSVALAALRAKYQRAASCISIGNESTQYERKVSSIVLEALQI